MMKRNSLFQLLVEENGKKVKLKQDKAFPRKIFVCIYRLMLCIAQIFWIFWVRAYKKIVKRSGEEPLLPGIKYNQKQLFWIR